MNQAIKDMLKLAWKLIVLVVGGGVLLLGVVLIVTPGPAFIVIPLGLAILATQFAWARRLLKEFKRRIAGVIKRKKFGAKNGRQTPQSHPGTDPGGR